MTVQAATFAQPFRGLRRLNPARDLGQVADLIESAFDAEPDGAQQGAVRDLRALDRSRHLVWLMSRISAEFHDALSGFVWVENGRVVGNASVTREDALGLRWLLSSVAVDRAYRRRGIARQMVLAAVQLAESHGGRWLELQVQESSDVAVGMYERTGFVPVEATATFRLATIPQGVPRPEVPGLRRIRWHEHGKVLELAREATPQHVQRVRPIRPEQFSVEWDRNLLAIIAERLGRPRTERWGVVEDGRLVASVRVKRRQKDEKRFDLLIAPDARGRFEAPLIATGLCLLSDATERPVLIDVSTRDAAAIDELRRVGFREIRTLVRMVKELRPA